MTGIMCAFTGENPINFDMGEIMGIILIWPLVLVLLSIPMFVDFIYRKVTDVIESCKKEK